MSSVEEVLSADINEMRQWLKGIRGNSHLLLVDLHRKEIPVINRRLTKIVEATFRLQVIWELSDKDLNDPTAPPANDDPISAALQNDIFKTKQMLHAIRSNAAFLMVEIERREWGKSQERLETILTTSEQLAALWGIKSHELEH